MRWINRILLALVATVIITVSVNNPALSQATLRQPTVFSTGLLNVTWTAGTVNNGGHAVTVAAGSTNITSGKTDCAAPTYTSCDIVYANSSGTVANTSTLATATAAGNTILAIAETNGTVITKLAFPNQNSQNFLAGLSYTRAFDCGTSAACVSAPATASWLLAGTVALTSASPSTASVSALSPAYTSSSSYRCVAVPEGTTAAVAAAGVAINKTSGSAFTLTGPNTVTTTIDWMCIGN